MKKDGVSRIEYIGSLRTLLLSSTNAFSMVSLFGPILKHIAFIMNGNRRYAKQAKTEN